MDFDCMMSHVTKKLCLGVTVSAVCERTVYLISALCSGKESKEREMVANDEVTHMANMDRQ